MSDISLESIFGHYTQAFLQDMASALKTMKDSGISVDDFLAFSKDWDRYNRNMLYERHKRQHELHREFYSKLPRCPQCGNPMFLYPVNDSPCRQVGGDLKSQWLCGDWKGCGEVQFSASDVFEEAQKFGLDFFYKPRNNKPDEQKPRRRGSRPQGRGAEPPKQSPRPCCGGGPR